MNGHDLDSASYGASREVHSEVAKIWPWGGVEFSGVPNIEIPGMLDQPDYDRIFGIGVEPDMYEEVYGGYVEAENLEALREMVRKSGISNHQMGRLINRSADAVRNVMVGDTRSKNKAYLGMVAYFEKHPVTEIQPRYDEKISDEQYAKLKSAIYTCGKTQRELAAAAGLGNHFGINHLMCHEAPRRTNKTYLALKAYFGLEG